MNGIGLTFLLVGQFDLEIYERAKMEVFFIERKRNVTIFCDLLTKREEKLNCEIALT
jgi:hypothetical protein